MNIVWPRIDNLFVSIAIFGRCHSGAVFAHLKDESRRDGVTLQHRNQVHSRKPALLQTSLLSHADSYCST